MRLLTISVDTLIDTAFDLLMCVILLPLRAFRAVRAVRREVAMDVMHRALCKKHSAATWSRSGQSLIASQGGKIIAYARLCDNGMWTYERLDIVNGHVVLRQTIQDAAETEALLSAVVGRVYT